MTPIDGKTLLKTAFGAGGVDKRTITYIEDNMNESILRLTFHYYILNGTLIVTNSTSMKICHLKIHIVDYNEIITTIRIK